MSKDLLFHSDTSSDEDYKKEKRKRKRLIHGRRKDSDDDVVVIEQVETAWSCNRCTYANSVGNQTCELCSNPRRALPATRSTMATAPPTPRRRSQDVRKSRSKPLVTAATPWTCQICTYINDTPCIKCSLCDAIRPTRTKLPAQLRRQPSMESIDSASDDDFSHHDASMSSQPSRPFSQGNDRSHPPSIEIDTALWNDKYRPHGMVDLVIHPKKAQEVSDWLVHSTHQRMLFLCGPPGTGKSTLVRSLATKLGMAVKEWQDTTGMSNRQHKAAAMDDFSSFLERSQRYPSLAFSSKASQTSSRHVILVEEWPSFYADHRAELQRVLQRRLDAQGDYAASPIVIVYSDVREGKVTTNMLAKEFSAQVMQSPLVHVIHCNPIAPGMLKRYLTQIARKERLSVSAQDVAHIVESCRGDIRHAMNTLQFQRTTDSNSTSSNGGRDPFLSDFHVLGKILHRKDLTDEKCRLSQTSLDTGHVLAMVHQNCLPYFTDIDDVARALDVFSFTDTLLHSVYHDRSNSNYFYHAQGIAQAMLERTMHVTNVHAAPSTFRPLTRSQLYSTSQHAQDTNQWKQGASYHRDVRPYERWLPQTSSAAPTLLVSADDVDDEIVDSD